jgi:hydroxymethylglutaryl-CoA reductase (NADPH)
MPSLEIGTIGGGSSLPTQKEALSIMGVAGGGNPPGSNSLKLAEIISAAVLAGELNLLGAQASRELGKAHKKLGRNIK